MIQANSDSKVAEGVSLLDLLAVLCSHWKVILGTATLAVVAALTALTLVSPRWEATAVTQIGQVWQGGTAAAPAMLIEAPSRAVERIRFKPFQLAVLAKLGIPLDERNPRTNLFTSSIVAQVIANTDLIEIRVRGFSSEEAKTWAEAVVKHLQTLHLRLIAPVLTKIRQEVEQTQRQMELVAEEKDKLLKSAALKAQVEPGARFAENLLLANLLAKKDEELAKLQLRKLNLEEQLNPAKTYTTSLIDTVYVPSKPSYPRKSFALTVAAVVGLIAGLCLALVVHIVRQGHVKPSVTGGHQCH